MDNSENTTPKWDIPKWDILTVTDMRNLFPSPGTTKEDEDKATRPPQKGD